MKSTIQRIILTPSNSRLIGSYLTTATAVIVECDSTLTGFNVGLPPLWTCESVSFEFHNPRFGNPITVSGASINYLNTSAIIYPGESVTFTDNFRGTWLAGNKFNVPAFGDVANGNYSYFESDGTLVNIGSATAWEDVGFPLIVKTTGTGRPTYAAFNGTLESLQWSINDIAQAVDNEIPHSHMRGGAMIWHVHFYTGVQDTTDRRLKWQISYSGSNYGSVSPAETVISSEILIPANTPIRTHCILDVGEWTPIDNPGFQVKASLKRIAASGTAPSVNPFCELMQLHFAKDGNGSRTVTTK